MLNYRLMTASAPEMTLPNAVFAVRLKLTSSESTLMHFTSSFHILRPRLKAHSHQARLRPSTSVDGRRRASTSVDGRRRA